MAILLLWNLLKVRSLLHAPCLVTLLQPDLEQLCATFCLLGDSCRFFAVPLMPLDSAEAIRTHHHRRHIVVSHVVLHPGLVRGMQIAGHKPPRLWQVTTRKFRGAMQRPMRRCERLFILNVNAWPSRRGKRKMPSLFIDVGVE